MNRVALLVVDVQTGNFSGSNPIYKGSELLMTIRNLINRARFTNTPVIYVQNSGGKGDPDEQGTPDWEIQPSIEPLKEDLVVEKSSSDAFHETGLHDALESINVKRLVIAGLQTEYCVDTTCRRAYTMGYEVALVRDAHSTWDSPQLTAQEIIDHHNRVLGGWFVDLKSTEEIRF